MKLTGDRAVWRERGPRILFCVGFLAVFLLYCYKLPLGVPSSDETFHLTIPQRLLQGDALLTDEWHGTQFASVLLLPLMAARDLLCAGSDGIVLQFRWLYAVVHGLACIALYLRLRHKGYAGAVGALALFLFTPSNVPALSYQTMGIDLVALSAALVVTAKSRRACFAAGLCYAGAVLCAPYLAAAFAVWSAGVLLWALVRREGETARRYLAFLGACALAAAVVCAFVLSRASLAQIGKVLPGILSDPEHPALTGKKVGALFRVYAAWRLPMGLWAVLLAAALLDRGRVHRRGFYFPTGVGLSLWMVFLCLPVLLTSSFDDLLFPLAPLGLLAWLLSERRDNKTAVFLYLGGGCYALCVFLASNQFFHAIVVSSAVTALAAILLVGDLLRELPGPKGAGWQSLACRGAAGALAVVLVCGMVYAKVNHKFRSTLPNSALTVTIDAGPYAGLRCAPQVAEHYFAELSSVRAALDRREGTVLYASRYGWYYLITPELKNGAFSAWLSGEGPATVDRLAAYYALRPDKVPDYIFVPADTSWDGADFSARLLEPYGFGAPTSYPQGTLYLRGQTGGGQG